MDTVKVLLFIAHILCWTGQVVSDDNDTRCICSPNGIRGEPGPEGPTGEKGDRGRSGRRGLKGDIGLPGMKGNGGETGPTGEKGSKGEKGSCDQQGPHVLLGGPGVPGASSWGPEETGGAGMSHQRSTRSSHIPQMCNKRQGNPGEKGKEGEKGVPGVQGRQGFPGRYGRKGLPGGEGRQGVRGLQGEQGDPGNPGREAGQSLSSIDTVQVARAVEHQLIQNVNSELSKIRASMMAIEECSIHESNWRQVIHIDMTDDPTAQCPDGLCKISNSTTNQTACFRSGCSVPLRINTGRNYTHVCGRVRGYQLQDIDEFNTTNNSHHADGIHITSGNLSTHLWTYAVGTSKKPCPCTYGNNSYPNPIGHHYHCDEVNEIGWNNSLWDNTMCVASNNTDSTKRNIQGWFYQNVHQPSDSIEVRWCGPNNDIVTNILQIWVQ